MWEADLPPIRFGWIPGVYFPLSALRPLGFYMYDLTQGAT